MADSVCMCTGAVVAVAHLLGTEVLQSEEQAQPCRSIVYKDVDACKVLVYNAMVVSDPTRLTFACSGEQTFKDSRNFSEDQHSRTAFALTVKSQSMCVFSSEACVGCIEIALLTGLCDVCLFVLNLCFCAHNEFHPPV